MKKVYIGIVVLGLLFAGCTMPAQNSNQNLPGTSVPNENSQYGSNEKVYYELEYGISMVVPEGMRQSSLLQNDASYLLPDSWSALDPNSGSGAKLASFQIDGSNDLIASGIRIGVSKDAGAVSACTASPEYATVTPSSREINDNMFTVIELSDAAMSKYQTVWSYRLVKDNTCYVFDTYIRGTNPEVYENPPVAAFDREEAEALLLQAMSGVRIDTKQ